MTTPTPQTTPSIYPISYHAVSPTISRWVPLRAIDIHSLRGLGMFDNGKPIYHLLNHPIKFLRITGVVVAIDEFLERRILTIDDSSGSCIECVCAAPPSTSTASTSTSVPNHLDQFKVQLTSAKDSSSKVESHPGKAGKDKDGKGDMSRKGTDNQPSTLNPLIPWESVDTGSVLKIKGQVTKFRDMMQVEVIKIDIIASTEGEVKCWGEVLAFRRDVLSKPWVVSEEEGRRCEKKAVKFERDKKKDRSGRSKVQERRKGSDREGKEDKRRGTETEEDRRCRHELKKRKKGTEKEAGGLDPVNKVNYPSMAVRMRLSGKYETLGI